MKQRLLILGLTILICALSITAQSTLTLQNGVKTPAESSPLPSRTIEYCADGVLVTYSFDTLTCIDDNEFEGNKIWKIEGFSLSNIPGTPAIPVRTDIFSIDAGFSVSLEEVNVEYKTYRQRLAPAIPSQDFDATLCEKRVAIKKYSGFLPTSNLRLREKQVYKDKELYYVEVTPLQYDMTNSIVKVASSLTYKLRYTTSAATRAATDNFATKASADDEIISATIPARVIIQEDAEPAKPKVPRYLIIAPTVYKQAAEKLASWKRCIGFDAVVVTKLIWSSTSITTTIKQYYNTEPGLDYFLFIGNNNNIPTLTFVEDDINYPSDFRYGCMDGDSDLVPDIPHGRIPVNSLAEANIAVQKIIDYEKNPPSAASYYQDFPILCKFEGYKIWNEGPVVPVLPSFELPSDIIVTVKDGYREKTRAVRTCEDISNYLKSINKSVSRYYSKDEFANTSTILKPQEYSHIYSSAPHTIPADVVELLHKGSMRYWTKDDWKTTISSIWNSGRNLITYLNHGDSLGWRNPYFKSEDVSMINATNGLPIVFSMACHTGNFTVRGSFVETLTISPNGANAVIASTLGSPAGPTEALTVLLFNNLFPYPGLDIGFANSTLNNSSNVSKPVYELGRSLNAALIKMDEITNEVFSTRITNAKYGFHCFGDPSMRVKTEVPSTFKNVKITRKSTDISVSCPQTGAVIIFYDITTGNVVNYWSNTTVNHSTANPDLTIVTISAQNFIPYISPGGAIISGVIE